MITRCHTPPAENRPTSLAFEAITSQVTYPHGDKLQIVGQRVPARGCWPDPEAGMSMTNEWSEDDIFNKPFIPCVPLSRPVVLSNHYPPPLFQLGLTAPDIKKLRPNLASWAAIARGFKAIALLCGSG